MSDKWASYPHPSNHEMQLYNLLKAMLKNDDVPPAIEFAFSNIINWLENKYPQALSIPNGAK